MSGFHQFYKSERLSDTKLLLIYSAKRAIAQKSSSDSIVNGSTLPSEVETSSAPSVKSSSNPTATSLLPSTSTLRKRKLSTLDDQSKDNLSEEEEVAVNIEIHIPAHKFILIAMSQYFSTLLETAVGESPTATLKMLADSVDELYAMEAVVEHIYADKTKLPLYCTDEVVPAKDGQACSVSRMHRLLSTLMVADHWQVSSCLSECSRAICALATASLTWDDCFAACSLSESLLKQPEVSGLADFAIALATHLANVPSIVLPPAPCTTLSANLDKLPVHVRIAMLTSNMLAFAPVKCLVSSDEQIADSEDDLASALNLYVSSSAGLACSAAERNELRDCLRCQHMSNNFVGLKLPHMPGMKYAPSVWPQLMYLRGLPGFADIPPTSRLDSIPEAWYKTARKQGNIPPSSFELTLNVSESDLIKQLAAGLLYKTNQTAPPILSSSCVELRQVSWCLHCGSSVDAFQVYVKPTCKGSRNSGTIALEKAGVYTQVIFRLLTSSGPITLPVKSPWVGPPGLGVYNFAQAISKRSGDPLDIGWWKDYIIDGHVRFSASVKLL